MASATLLIRAGLACVETTLPLKNKRFGDGGEAGGSG